MPGRRKEAYQIALLIALALSCLPGQIQAALQDKNVEFGPQVSSYLELLKQEEEELEFQIKHKEISRRDYLRARNRINVYRRAIKDIVIRRGEDLVPELHAVVLSEIKTLFPDGIKDLNRLKQDHKVNENWRFVGVYISGEKFYLFERVR